jgi:ferrous iron transport protein B
VGKGPEDFLVRAFTIILLAKVVIWFLQTFDLLLNARVRQRGQLLALGRQVIAPFLPPAGF